MNPKIACLLLGVCAGMGCSDQRPAREEVAVAKKVMVSPLAGQWYQDSERALRDEIAERSKGIHVVRKKGVCAAVVPHAGYRYSGHVAAGAYLRIDPKALTRVVVMGPSHYVAMHNQISVPDATHFRTPLGELRADTEFIDRLRKLPFVTHVPAAHVREHSDQIQLPLIQACLSTNLAVVCLICGQFDVPNLLTSAQALRQLMDPGTLVVISSDFTHHGASYGYEPFTNNVLKNIESLDSGIFDLFANKDIDAFLTRLNKTGATVCGRDPLALLLAMMPEDAEVMRTGYEMSAQVTGDEHNSVSYLGALVKGTWHVGVPDRASSVPMSEKIPAEDCTRLLTLARETIRRALNVGERSAAREAPLEMTAGLRAVRGGFVTLHKGGELRGCIGEIVPRREIWKVVREQAINAAFHDPRFPVLREDELDAIDIEISMLSPPKPVTSWREIEIGRHGIVLSKGAHQAVFLPQVALEQGWGIEETLSHLSIKAGLAEDDWRSDTDFLVFEAQVIHEKRGEE